jgi:hypothetical protein
VHTWAAARTRRQFFFLFLAILAIKVIFLCLDSTPSYFLGDSASYLATATINWIPGDRSFLYGFFISLIAVHTHSLVVLVCVQALLSAITAWLLSFALSFLFRVRFVIAAVFGLLCAVEPLQLLMERYVMTETLANFVFAVYFILLLFYIKQGKLLVLLAAQAVGILLIAIRMSFLPEVLVNSVLAPLLSPAAMMFWRRLGAALRGKVALATSNQIQLVAVHLILSLLVSQGVMRAYEDWNGSLSKREPALLYENGGFLLSAFSPLVEPQDFPAVPQRDAIFKEQKFDRHDVNNRLAEHFAVGGFWPSIQKTFPDSKQANDIAEETAVNAIERQPAPAARLVLRTFIMYFDRARMHEWLLIDEGYGGVMGEGMKDWLRRYYGIPDPKVYQLTLTKRWHLTSYPWYWVVLCALCASPVLLFLCRRREVATIVLCVSTAWMLTVMVSAIMDRPTPRYLVTNAWLTLLLFGFAVHAIARPMRQRRSGTPGAIEAESVGRSMRGGGDG